MNKRTFNCDAVGRQLSGAKVALDKCIQKVNSGDYDEEAPLVIAIDFQQVLYQLCLAWHFQFRTEEELARRTSAEYIELSNIVPNFGFKLRLMSGIDCEGEICGHEFNREAVRQELSEALLALQKCEEKTESGAYDEDRPLVIAVDFQRVLTHLCLAWHFKDMTHEAIKGLTHEQFDRLANTVPNFGFSLKLLSGIDPVPTKSNHKRVGS